MKIRGWIRKKLALLLALIMVSGMWPGTGVRADEYIITDTGEAEEAEPVEMPEDYEEVDNAPEAPKDPGTMSVEEHVEETTDEATTVEETTGEETTDEATTVEETTGEATTAGEQVEDVTLEQPEEEAEAVGGGETAGGDKAAGGDETEEAGKSGTEETSEEQTLEEVSISADELPYRLLVLAEDESIFNEGYIISSYESAYIVGFITEEDRKAGLSYYCDKAIYAEYDDEIFEVSEQEIAEEQDDSEELEAEDPDNSEKLEIVEREDALTYLTELDEPEIPDDMKEKKIIALIDSGVGDGTKVVDSVSVIGDDVSDDNGHGSEMADIILAENPDAKIISIKAFGADGKARPSDIYAAIRYAIDSKVDIISMSFAAFSTEESSAIKDIIIEAVEKNITVIGAAGNKGKDVKYFIPGSVKEAIIIGACDDLAVRLGISNFGDTVDYYVVADSTSEAAAIFTGNYSGEGIETERIKKADEVKQERNAEDVQTEENDVRYYNLYELATHNPAASGLYAFVKYIPQSESASDYIEKAVRGPLRGTAGNDGYIYKPNTHGKIYLRENGKDYTAPLVCVDDKANAFDYGPNDNPEHDGQTIDSATDYGSEISYIPLNKTNISAILSGKPNANAIETLIKRAVYALASRKITVNIGDSVGINYLNRYSGMPYSVSGTSVTQTAWPDTTEGVPLQICHNIFCYIFGRYVGVDSLGYDHADTDSGIVSSAGSTDLTVEGAGSMSVEYFVNTYLNSAAFVNEFNNSNYTISINYYTAKNPYTDSGVGRVQNFITFDVKKRVGVGMIEVYKYDGDNVTKPLKGAVFTVYSDSACTRAVGTITTDKNGHGSLTGLSNGTYYVKETTAPSGYAPVQSAPYTVTINSAKGTYYFNGSYMGYAFDAAAYKHIYKNESGIVEMTDDQAFNHFITRGVGRTGGEYASHPNGNHNFNAKEYGGMNPDITERWNSMSAAEKSVYKNGDNEPSEFLYYAWHYATYGAGEGRMGRTIDFYQSNQLAAGINNNNSTVVILKVPNKIVKKPYYIAISKKDAFGYAMRGVTFNLSFYDNDAKVTRKFNAALSNGTYNGIWSGYDASVSGTSSMSSYSQDSTPGVSVIYLGEYAAAPSSIKVQENWIDISGTGTGWDGGTAYIYKGEDWKKVNKKDYEASTDSIENIKAYNTAADARGHAASVTFVNIQKVYLKLIKASSDRSISDGNPNYSLSGTTYGLYTSEVDARNNTGAIHTFNIDANGNSDVWNIPKNYMNSDSSSGGIKNTTFYAREIKSGKGFKLNTELLSVTVAPSNTAASPAVLNVKDEPEYFDAEISISKADMDGTSSPEGAATLNGAEFTVNYYKVDVGSDYTAEQLASMTPDKTWIVTADYNTETKRYSAEINAQGKKLAYGYMTISETKAPAGYNLKGVSYRLSDGAIVNDEVLAVKINSRDELNISGKSVTGDITACDKVIRGDIEIIKKDLQGNPMKDVEFEVKSISTGEIQVIKTDDNGYYNSKDAGLWFGMRTDGTSVDMMKGMSALQFGEYLIREIPCEANDGMQLEPELRIKVTENKTYRVFDENVTAKEIFNVPMPTISTTASVSGNGCRQASETDTATITDAVSYEGLKARETYILEGRLMVVGENGEEGIYQKNGEDYIVTRVFTTDEDYEYSIYEKSGVEEMQFEIDTAELAGKNVVVFERLYLGNEIPENDEDIKQYGDIPIFPIIHEDITIKEQTIAVPHIRTTAYITSEAETNIDEAGTNIDEADDEMEEKGIKEIEIDIKEYDTSKPIEIADKVNYYGLVPGYRYRIEGIIMDKNTGEPFTVSGNNVTASEIFVPEAADGRVTVTFSLPLKEYIDKLTENEDPYVGINEKLDVVVYEELYLIRGDGGKESEGGEEKEREGEEGDGEKDDNERYSADIIIAEHKDLDDLGQSVSVIIYDEAEPKEEVPPENPDNPVPDNPVPDQPDNPTPDYPTPDNPDNPPSETPVPSVPPATYVAPPDRHRTPPTGDESGVAIPILILIGSAALVYVVIKQKQKS